MLLEPAAPAEVHHQTDRDEAGDGHRDPEQGERPVGYEAPVLAEEAGDDGEDEKNGREARQDLHDLVQPVRSRGEVRVDHVRGELAEWTDLLEVRVDHRVEKRVKKKTGRVKPPIRKALLDEPARREVALVHRHDRVVSDEDRDLVVIDDVWTR